jgi:hypothetical protein
VLVCLAWAFSMLAFGRAKLLEADQRCRVPSAPAPAIVLPSCE